MQIALVAQRFHPLVGGAERVLWELSQQLVRLGHQVTVVTAWWQQDWPAQEQRAGVTIRRLPLPPVRFWGTWRYVAALEHWLKECGRDFDLWYVSMLKHSAWACLGPARCRSIPVVVRPEGSGPTGDVQWQRRAWGGRLIRRRCRTADAIVALSEQIRRELLQYRYPAQRIHQIPNGVPVPPETDESARQRARSAIGQPSGAPLAIYVGRLSPEKGLDILLSAWSRVLHDLPDARLIIVGDGPQRAELQRQAAEMPSVLWAGQQPDPRPYLQAADAFVLPSFQEGVSIALLEAMAHGLPVVATDIAGNRAVIEPGRHGLLVRPGSPSLLGDAIILQLRAKTLAAGMGRAARQRALDRFSIQRMAERHLELFDRLRTDLSRN